MCDFDVGVQHIFEGTRGSPESNPHGVFTSRFPRAGLLKPFLGFQDGLPNTYAAGHGAAEGVRSTCLAW